jgi:hypothetical protein
MAPPPPFENLRDGETMEVAGGIAIDEQKKKKKVVKLSFSQKKVVNFWWPRKWPPLSNFLGTPLLVFCRIN